MKNTIRLFVLALLALMLMLSATSCDDLGDIGGIISGGHVHEFGEWETTKSPSCTADGEKTRYCSCGETQTVLALSEGHGYKDGVCTVCGAKEFCDHANVTTVEGTPPTCTTAGTSDYKVCADCGAVITAPSNIPASHTYVGGICTNCGDSCPHDRKQTIPGTESTCTKQGLTDGIRCRDCGVTILAQEALPLHNYVDGVCVDCGEAKSKYPWETTTILVQLYENDNSGEFSAGLKRYCAGQDTEGTEEIDSLVKERNMNAYADTNVNVLYNYETGFAWGGSVQDIQTLATSGSSSAPDIFANFTYDMTSCALRGCFANLYANTEVTSTVYGSGNNYFAFTKDGYESFAPDNYFDSNAGEGYFYDYMQSLAFVNEDGVYDKMYCLASNYTMDAIRSFLVVPVNVNMLEAITVETSTGDVNGDWVFDIEDFYSLVWQYQWTYDALAALSKAVYSPDNSANPNADILDTLGFCLGSSSGLSAAGVLYTTSVGIIEKYQDAETGKWTYAYPTSNQKLVDLANALYKLFENNTSGLATLTVEQATNVGLGDGRSELVAIRGRFAQDKILFGGIIAVGSLEDTVYQQMNYPGKKGFGIVPVPLYTQKYDESGNALSVADGGEEYNTLVHNLARIFAISANTYKFEQCSAFLDYVSTNSADIVDKYCESYLVAADDVIDGSSYNVYMFNYLKNHARDCFDKTYEDMIYKYQLSIDHNASTKRWHTIFSINNYQVSNMAQRYQEIYPEKQNQLETILREWSRLK